MEYYVDRSVVEAKSICVVDQSGSVVERGSCQTAGKDVPAGTMQW